MARDPWLDNAKMTLVTLVVIGHFWAVLPDTGVSDHLYDFLYTWHIPAFVLVTGYLSRSFEWTRPRLLGLVTTVAVPYVVFEALYALFRLRVGDERFDDLFLDPHWPLWYLTALFVWRLATPVLKRHWVFVPLAFAASIVGGAYAGEQFDLARVVGFLPFFVLGLHATPARLAVLRTARARVVGVVVLLAVLASAGLVDALAGTEWVYYRARYTDLDVSDPTGMAIRAGFLGAGLIGTLAFLTVVPRRASWWAEAGTWTIVVYLFHGFFVKGLGYSGVGDWSDGHAVLALIGTTVLAVTVAVLLSWAPLARRLNYVVDPYGSVLRWRRRRLDRTDPA